MEKEKFLEIETKYKSVSREYIPSGLGNHFYSSQLLSNIVDQNIPSIKRYAEILYPGFIEKLERLIILFVIISTNKTLLEVNETAETNDYFDEYFKIFSELNAFLSKEGIACFMFFEKHLIQLANDYKNEANKFPLSANSKNYSLPEKYRIKI